MKEFCENLEEYFLLTSFQEGDLESKLKMAKERFWSVLEKCN